MEKRKLILFTSAFPYGEGEQFIETEIRVLAESFDHILIYPLSVNGNPRPLPLNATVVVPELYRPHNRLKTLIKNIVPVTCIYVWQLAHSRQKAHYVKNFRHWLTYLLNRFNDADWLSASLKDKQDSSTIIYSYWFNLWATMLSIIKLKEGKSFGFITRIHGGDFDEAQKKDGIFPFREFELKQVKTIYAVSQFGISYMKERYSNLQFTIQLSRLGVNNNGDTLINNSKGYFHIVSCSFIYGLKRVDKLIDILSELKSPVKWTHFGDGVMAGEIKNYAKEKLGGKITFDFKGLVPNNDVLEFYRTNPVDLFLNTSELEGIPVSMMEAISFSIPIVGCSICGVPEIVTSKTGILIPKQFEPSAVAKQIDAYLNTATELVEERKKEVKQFWETNFNAVTNYKQFIKMIKSN